MTAAKKATSVPEKHHFIPLAATIGRCVAKHKGNKSASSAKPGFRDCHILLGRRTKDDVSYSVKFDKDSGSIKVIIGRRREDSSKIRIKGTNLRCVGDAGSGIGFEAVPDKGIFTEEAAVTIRVTGSYSEPIPQMKCMLALVVETESPSLGKRPCETAGSFRPVHA